jgi:hypothetical protein
MKNIVLPKAKTVQNRQKGGFWTFWPLLAFGSEVKKEMSRCVELVEKQLVERAHLCDQEIILDTQPFFIKTAAEILDTVRQVFPNARIVREPVSLVARECLICGRVYYGRSEAESHYCSNECAAVSHRRYKNPHRTRIRSLRDQCRASWRQALDRAEPQSFEEWLYRFEKFLERMCEMRREPPADQDL